MMVMSIIINGKINSQKFSGYIVNFRLMILLSMTVVTNDYI